jgi:glycosyltransferase involved in cell wall biosynthesis
MRQIRAPEPGRPVGSGTELSFSVIIPAYNAAATIGAAVESVLAQTLPAHEVVVCDDGSTDELEAALGPYRDRIAFVRKENGGEGSAKDAASRAANGDFVVVLDADDAFLPERLEALAELARARPDLDVLTTDAFLESEGRVVRRAYSAGWLFEVEDQRRVILERNFVFGAAAVRCERLVAVGGFDASLRYAADWDLWIRMILSGSRVGLVDEPLYRYRIGPHALSARRAPLVRGFVTVLERAAVRSDLEPAEQQTVERAIAAKRRELVQLELEEALAGASGAAARARAAAVLREGELPARARIKAFAALVAPRLAARVQKRRRAGAWVGAGGTLVAARPTVRLVAYTDAEEIGGAEVSLGHVLAGLGGAYDVTVMGIEERVVARLAASRPGARTCLLAPVRRKYHLRGVLAHVREMRRLRPAIVHVSLKTPWACQYGILAAFLAGARVVLVEQSLFPEESRLRRAFARVAGRQASAVVAVGDRSAREIERLVGLRPGSVRTIRNGVPELRPAPPPPGAQARPVVGSVGRLDAEKGYETLLRALPGLSATAVLVGDGPDRGRLERLAAELGVAEQFVVAGWTDDPRRHLASFTVFCLPSRSESFPLTIVEAMLAGLAVVSTDVGSVAEAVRDGQTGLLVPRDDPQALADALRRLLDDTPLRDSMGRRGRELALECFTAERMVASFEQLYEEMLA